MNHFQIVKKKNFKETNRSYKISIIFFLLLFISFINFVGFIGSASAYDFETYQLNPQASRVRTLKGVKNDYLIIKIRVQYADVSFSIINSEGYNEYLTGIDINDKNIIKNGVISCNKDNNQTWGAEIHFRVKLSESSPNIIFTNLENDTIAIVQAEYYVISGALTIGIEIVLSLIILLSVVVVYSNLNMKKSQKRFNGIELREKENKNDKDKENIDKSKLIYQVGAASSYVGEFLISLQGLFYFLETKNPFFDETTQIALSVPILIFVFLEMLIVANQKFNLKGLKGLAVFLLFPVSFASLMFGGGWFIGIVLLIIGIYLRIGSNQINHIFDFFSRKPQNKSPDQSKSLMFLNYYSVKKIFSRSIFILVILSSVVVFSQIMIAPNMRISQYSRSYPEMSGDPRYENILYITPIWETMNPSNYEQDLIEIQEIKDRIGPDGPYAKVGFSVSCWYSANLIYNETTNKWDFNPTNLLYKLRIAEETNTPILFHMNGGNWGACGMSNELLRELWANDSNCQWDQYNNVPEANYSQACLKDRLFSLALNTTFNLYREYHIKQAGSIIANWANEHPDLFVGCSLDSEIHLDSGKDNEGNELYYDYNPLVINEFRVWLKEKYGSISNLNKECDTNFVVDSFNDIDAPRVAKIGDPFWEAWTDFRHEHVRRAVAAQSRWLSEVGIAKEKIYAHQILAEEGDKNARYGRCDTLETAVNEYGVPGYTRYGVISEDRLWDIYNVAGTNWGLFEWNLWSQHSTPLYVMQLKAMYRAGIHVICPNGWYEFVNPGLFIKYDYTFLDALQIFLNDIRDYPRLTSPKVKLSALDQSYLQSIKASHFADNNDNLLIYLAGGCELIALLLWAIEKRNNKKKTIDHKNIQNYKEKSP